MFADNTGSISGFSSSPEDCKKARRMRGKALLPGLVNAHSHSFQRSIRGRTEHRTGPARDTFWTWREAMYEAANRLTPDDIYAVARMAFLEMALAGISTVGEFHYLHHAPDGTPYDDPNLLAKQVLRAAETTGLRIALLRAAYARAAWNQNPNPAQRRFLTPEIDRFTADTEELHEYIGRSFGSGRAWAGIAPHSVRAVPLDYLVGVTWYARANGMPLHMHVSEQPAEIEGCLAEHRLRPVELLDKHGILDSRFTAVHAIHLAEGEAVLLGSARSHVCACPTTERNLGDGAVPADRLQDAGARICFGSDSNVQIDLLEDARGLEYHLRMQKLERAVLARDCESGGLAAWLFANATAVGADSLGANALGANLGRLDVGCAADFFTVDLNDPSLAGADEGSLLSHIVFSAGRSAIRDTFVAGAPILEDEHHAIEAKVIEEFRTVQRKLWAS
jgi:formimidoylglutamate deiminase